ncbi:hypothetical protein ACFLRO_01675 [Bacteroidota bacterium]
MHLVRLIPALLSAILLAAHFSRMGSPILAILSLLLPAVLFFRHEWAARLVQVALIYGAIEWVRTLLFFVEERNAVGQPWIRLAIILGFVAVFTLGSALLFSFSRPLRRRYGLDESSAEEGAS